MNVFEVGWPALHCPRKMSVVTNAAKSKSIEIYDTPVYETNITYSKVIDLQLWMLWYYLCPLQLIKNGNGCYFIPWSRGSWRYLKKVLELFMNFYVLFVQSFPLEPSLRFWSFSCNLAIAQYFNFKFYIYNTISPFFLNIFRVLGL